MSDKTQKAHPVSELHFNQLVVKWVPRETLKPNTYNPNRMTAQDRALLRQSILEDGWTQPIVALSDGTIVDGEQRWTVAGFPITVSDIDAIIYKMEERKGDGFLVSESIMARLQEARRVIAELEEMGEQPTLAAITSGEVPVTMVDFKDRAHQMISTIRHNRARGTHALDLMADITQDLHQLGLDFDDLEVRLGMETEEIHRLLETAALPDQVEVQEPSKAWKPVHISELTDDELAARELERSRAAAQEAKAHQLQLLERKKQIDEQAQQRIEAAEAERGAPLTQPEKDDIRAEVEAAVPVPAKPELQEMRRFTFFVTLPEFDMCNRVLGDPPIQGFMSLCREAYQARFGETAPA